MLLKQLLAVSDETKNHGRVLRNSYQCASQTYTYKHNIPLPHAHVFTQLAQVKISGLVFIPWFFIYFLVTTIILHTPRHLTVLIITYMFHT